MSVKISGIGTAITAPAGTERYEVSFLVSTGPDVWDTRYITWTTTKAKVLNSASLTTGYTPYWNGTDLVNSPLYRVSATQVALGGTTAVGLFTVHGDGTGSQYGLSHKNGAIEFATYCDPPAGGGAGAWIGTKSNHPLYVMTNDGGAGLNLSFHTDGSIEFNQLAADTVPYINASNRIVSSAVTPTELGYLSGVTSAIQSQINARLLAANNLSDLASAGTSRINIGAPFTLYYITTGTNMADGTTYYFNTSDMIMVTTDTNAQQNFGYSFRIIGVNFTTARNSTAGTSELATLKLRNVTQGASTTIGSVTTDATTVLCKSYTFTGLSIDVASTDSIALQLDTPTWATNPVGNLCTATLICIRT